MHSSTIPLLEGRCTASVEATELRRKAITTAAKGEKCKSADTKQNADKFRACARASSASACRPRRGLLPSAFDIVNVHPSCPVVKTPGEPFIENVVINSRPGADRARSLTGTDEVVDAAAAFRRTHGECR